MKKTRLQLGNTNLEVSVARQNDHVRVTLDGQTAELRLLYQHGPYMVLEQTLTDGTVKRLHVAGYKDGDKRQLWVNGRTLTYRRLRQGKQTSSTADANALAPTIPAVVSQVLVNVGDTVAAGDKLILLESMKMVIPIKAPYAGTVTAVHCAAGDAVQPGNQLVELKPQTAE